MILVPKAEASWARGTDVHPHIDNLRVVGIINQNMTRGEGVPRTWRQQEQHVVPEVVWESMDKLASGLTGSRSAVDAWRSIFVRPLGKAWSDVVVAIKTNTIGYQHTRSAVLTKICHVLSDVVGVKTTNINIYDGIHGGDMTEKTPFFGLPPGCRVQGTWGGVTRGTRVSSPWRENGARSKCIGPLVTGAVDILVNIAVCKGHSPRFGGFTMTMKNHLGTFLPQPVHQTGGLDYLLAINQTQEILGSWDKKTGNVLYPRQQLCLVDALWASEGGPGGCPSHQSNFLAMGVFSPVVDYVVATKFRGETMGWEPNMQSTRRLLTDFGYSERDLPGEDTLILV
jgi:hypothetical protein